MAAKRTENFDSNLTDQAAQYLRSGKVIIAPTDTHYTLMADPLNVEATAEIYKIKERDPDFPLTVFLSDPSQIDCVAIVDERVHQLVKEHWPGFLTLIVPKRVEAVPDHVTAGLQTVAVACHHNPIFVKLLKQIGGYAACTSANLSGQGADLITSTDAREQLGRRVSLFIEGGKADASKGNSIVDLTGSVPVLVREGEIPFGVIRSFLPNIVNQSATYKMELKQRQRSVATWRPTLEGKIALVTGAARGRGSEITRILANCGVHVLSTDISIEGESLVRELKEEGLDVEFCTLDITKLSSWNKAVEEVIAHWGKLDLLINNAGFFNSDTLDKLDEGVWQTALQVNTSGAIHGLQAVSSIMGAGGSIVNMSSVFGMKGRSYTGIAYEVSKGALLPLTRSTARQLAIKGIRVNAVAPGLIRTPMTEKLFESQNITAEVPLGRAVSIFDIVNAVCFLASPVSEYITGTVLTVDGGLST